MTQAEIFAHFERHEGVIDHMYLDTVGKVTIGIGFMMPDAAAALDYKLINRKTGAPATAAEIAADWSKVHEQQKGRIASTYRKFTKLDLPEAETRKLLKERLDGFAAILRTRFAGFDAFPAPARLALLDMIFNLGPTGLTKGFPKLCRAADRGDWKVCAAECNRLGIHVSRNDETRDLFLAAAAASTPAPAPPPLSLSAATAAPRKASAKRGRARAAAAH